jgi:Fe-S oxidoreductase
MAKMKAEFMQHWQESHGISLRTRIIAYLPVINRLGSVYPSFYNFVIKNRFFSGLLKKTTGFAAGRSIPLIYNITLRRWISKNPDVLNPSDPRGSVCLFVDEFTNYNDTETGIRAIKLLSFLHYRIVIIPHGVSARTFISKGLLRQAKQVIRENIKIFADVINDNLPLVGIEPSAILGFRDEYPDLAGDDLKPQALKIARNSYLIDEFIAREFREGRIVRSDFTDREAELLLHTHCQQKAIATSASLIEALSIPVNFNVKEIPSGCCGMAGSFGYEREHFDLSNKIGELVLFPEIRKSTQNVIIVAPGTSCRHHIADGTGRSALHPVDVLYDAIRRKQ